MNLPLPFSAVGVRALRSKIALRDLFSLSLVITTWVKGGSGREGRAVRGGWGLGMGLGSARSCVS